MQGLAELPAGSVLLLPPNPQLDELGLLSLSWKLPDHPHQHGGVGEGVDLVNLRQVGKYLPPDREQLEELLVRGEAGLAEGELLEAPEVLAYADEAVRELGVQRLPALLHGPEVLDLVLEDGRHDVLELA